MCCSTESIRPDERVWKRRMSRIPVRSRNSARCCGRRVDVRATVVVLGVLQSRRYTFATMCGIAGAVWIANSPGIDAADLDRMTRVITHRGPDDDGQYLDPRQGVALGFRRLSIIDLAGGHQPLGNEDGSVQIVFN